MNDPPQRIRLLHVIYAATVLGSGAAVGKVPGFLIALCVVLFWAFVFYSSMRRTQALAHALCGVIVLGVLASLILPATSRAPMAANRMRCSNRLKQIVLALQNYQDVFHTFP